jgi:hypothetical protein
MSRAEAVLVGRELFAGGFLHHVVDDHDFEDAFLFYRFYMDEERQERAQGVLRRERIRATSTLGGSSAARLRGGVESSIPSAPVRVGVGVRGGGGEGLVRDETGSLWRERRSM